METISTTFLLFITIVSSLSVFLIAGSYTNSIYAQNSSQLTNASSTNLDPGQLGLDLTYPQGWSMDPGYYTTLYPPERDDGWISIHENPFPGMYKDLKGWADNDIADFKGNGTISTIQQTSNTISGNPAYTIHFNFRYNLFDTATGELVPEGDFAEYQITYIDFGDVQDRFYKFEYIASHNESFLKYLNDVNNVITSASLRK